MGVSFQTHTICPEVVERPFDRLTVLSHIEGHLILTDITEAPQNKFLSDGPRMCLSGAF